MGSVAGSRAGGRVAGQRAVECARRRPGWGSGPIAGAGPVVVLDGGAVVDVVVVVATEYEYDTQTVAEAVDSNQ